MGDRPDHGPAARPGQLGLDGIPRHGQPVHSQVFDRAAIGLALLSPDGETIRDANPALCAILGYPAGALAGRPLADLGEAAEPRPSGIRLWHRADGVAAPVRVRPSTDGDDHVLVVEAVDAEEFVRAEQNREALTAAGLGEWRWDVATGAITLSRRAAHILGVPAAAPLAWPALQARIAPEEVARIRALVAEAALAGEPYAVEFRFRRAGDGREVRVSARGQATRGPDGALSGMVGVVQDVTTRIETRDALRDSEQRLRIASSLAALGIFEWHMLDDRAIWENDRMFAIFGRARGDGAAGKAEFFDEILHPDDRASFRSAISTALREDTVFQASGRIRRRGDGAWRMIEMGGRFEREASHRLPRRLIGVVADVTDERLAEERRSLLIRELHHRVKNTLSTVQAIVGSTARTASSIESFHEAFVGRIMSLAHTHSVLTEDRWQTASLRSLLVNELKPYAEGAMDGSPDARIVLDGPPVDLASEIAVPIGMAIHELTTNAAKYGALSVPSGQVTVAWSLVPEGPAGTLRFAWCETGGPAVVPPSRRGFGSRLLQRVLTMQVKAEVAIAYQPEGLQLTMIAPLPSRDAARNPLA